MKSSFLTFFFFFTLITFSCQKQHDLQPDLQLQNGTMEANLKNGIKPDNAACWGQASAVFARMRAMGIHSSSQSNPRLGLRNLARELFEMGVIADDSMQALGVFVVNDLGLSIEACE